AAHSARRYRAVPVPCERRLPCGGERLVPRRTGRRRARHHVRALARAPSARLRRRPAGRRAPRLPRGDLVALAQPAPDPGRDHPGPRAAGRAAAGHDAPLPAAGDRTDRRRRRAPGPALAPLRHRARPRHGPARAVPRADRDLGRLAAGAARLRLAGAAPGDRRRRPLRGLRLVPRAGSAPRLGAAPRSPVRPRPRTAPHARSREDIMTTSPFTRRTVLASSAVLASTAALAACGGGDDGSDTAELIENPDDNINPEGMPIVEEPVTISLMTRRANTSAEDWNQVSSVQETQEITNIEIDWGLVGEEAVAERRNLTLTSGDYPEAFYRTGVPGGDIAKYGEQGVFVALNDLIDQYMPNLTARMEEYPALRTGLTFPDGNIYSLPGIYDPTTLGLRYQTKLWARQDWLDAAGMSAPETLEEDRAYLEEVKGSHDGAVPLGGQGIGGICSSLYGTFGIANQGTDAGAAVDLDPDTGAVRYYPTSDGYRDLLEFLQFSVAVAG